MPFPDPGMPGHKKVMEGFDKFFVSILRAVDPEQVILREFPVESIIAPTKIEKMKFAFSGLLPEKVGAYLDTAMWALSTSGSV
jgi:hypothetical protein